MYVIIYFLLRLHLLFHPEPLFPTRLLSSKPSFVSNHQSLTSDTEKTITSPAKKKNKNKKTLLFGFSFASLKELVLSNSDCPKKTKWTYGFLFARFTIFVDIQKKMFCPWARFRLTELAVYECKLSNYRDFTNLHFTHVTGTWHTVMFAKLARLLLSVGWAFVLVAKDDRFCFLNRNARVHT